MSDGASLQLGVVAGRIGSVQASVSSKYFHRCNLDDSKSCCEFRFVFGRPCRHECRLAANIGVKPESLVAKELTVAHDRAVFSAAIDRVSPMDSTRLEIDDLKPPAWEGRRARGRPKGSRNKSDIDRSKGCASKRSTPPVNGAAVEEPAAKKACPARKCSTCHAYGHNARTCTKQI
jgi:hypothetical protein